MYNVLVFMCVALYALLLRSIKRARDIRDQLEGLMERVEMDVKSNILDSVAIRKVGVKWISPCICMRFTNDGLCWLSLQDTSITQSPCQREVCTRL